MLRLHRDVRLDWLLPGRSNRRWQERGSSRARV